MKLMISLPRSGSHLFAQMTQSKMVVLFVRDQYGPVEQAKSKSEILQALHKLESRSRQRNYWTHLPYHHEYESFVNNCESSFLLLRDPRDMIVSHAYVVEKMPDISLNFRIGERHLCDLPLSERVDFLIDHMRPFLLWFESWRVFGMQTFYFEDFIRDPLPVCERLESIGYGDAVVMMKRARYKHPAYFRSGKIGDWKKVFTEEQVERADENFGDLIERWREQYGSPL